MRLFDSVVAPVRREPPNRPQEAGEDQRVDTDAYSGHPHHQSFYVKTEASTGFDPAESRQVEVQAFLLGDVQTLGVVALRISGPFGAADVLTSSQEARAVALALLRSADDCDRLRAGERARV